MCHLCHIIRKVGLRLIRHNAALDAMRCDAMQTCMAQVKLDIPGRVCDADLHAGAVVEIERSLVSYRAQPGRPDARA